MEHADPISDQWYWQERLSSPPPNHVLWGHQHLRAQLTESILAAPLVACGRPVDCPFEAGVIATAILAGSYVPPPALRAPETEALPS